MWGRDSSAGNPIAAPCGIFTFPLKSVLSSHKALTSPPSVPIVSHLEVARRAHDAEYLCLEMQRRDRTCLPQDPARGAEKSGGPHTDFGRSEHRGRAMRSSNGDCKWQPETPCVATISPTDVACHLGHLRCNLMVCVHLVIREFWPPRGDAIGQHLPNFRTIDNDARVLLKSVNHCTSEDVNRFCGMLNKLRDDVAVVIAGGQSTQGDDKEQKEAWKQSTVKSMWRWCAAPFILREQWYDVCARIQAIDWRLCEQTQ